MTLTILFENALSHSTKKKTCSNQRPGREDMRGRHGASLALGKRYSTNDQSGEVWKEAGDKTNKKSLAWICK